ncbi:hypothetical protein [Maridesulfovibrio sp.]|uniref:hypothetical protein n=1 Tax=Maridesulfovibrio sp. TaxID=2795000 RepID=UPI0039EEC5F5
MIAASVKHDDHLVSLPAPIRGGTFHSPSELGEAEGFDMSESGSYSSESVTAISLSGF